MVWIVQTGENYCICACVHTYTSSFLSNRTQKTKTWVLSEEEWTSTWADEGLEPLCFGINVHMTQVFHHIWKNWHVAFKNLECKHPQIHSFRVNSLQQILLKTVCHKSTNGVEFGKVWLLQALTWTSSKDMKCKHLNVCVLICLVWWRLWLNFLSTWLLHVTSPHSLSTEASLDFFSEQCLPCPDSECPREKENFRKRERDSESMNREKRIERRSSQGHLAVCDLAWEVIVLLLLQSIN